MIMSNFSYAYLSLIYHLWWSVCSDHLHIFFNWSFLFPYCWVLSVHYIFWIQVLYLDIICKYFLVVYSLLFPFPNSVFLRAVTKSAWYWQSPVHQFFFSWNMNLMSSWNTCGHNDVLFPSHSFIFLHITLKSMINF